MPPKSQIGGKIFSPQNWLKNNASVQSETLVAGTVAGMLTGFPNGAQLLSLMRVPAGDLSTRWQAEQRIAAGCVVTDALAASFLSAKRRFSPSPSVSVGSPAGSYRTDLGIGRRLARPNRVAEPIGSMNYPAS
jgi:hypothetical protein